MCCGKLKNTKPPCGGLVGTYVVSNNVRPRPHTHTSSIAYLKYKCKCGIVDK